MLQSFVFIYITDLLSNQMLSEQSDKMILKKSYVT